MTTTVQNVFAGSNSDSFSIDGPNISCSYPGTPTDTSTGSYTHSPAHYEFDSDGPSNTYDSTRYVYEVTYQFTSINISLLSASIGSNEVSQGTQSSSGLGTFNYRGSGTQAGATDNLPASSSTTQFVTVDAGDRSYQVFRTFSRSASWHWEGNLFTIDGVGSDTFEDITVQSTLTCSAGVDPGGIANLNTDAQLTCDASKTHSGELSISSQFAQTTTSAVTHDFDISGVVVSYVESFDPYTATDYVATGYFDDGIYIPDDYVETQTFTGVIQAVASDGQLTCVAGFVKSGDTSIAGDCQVTVSGDVRASLQGAATIAADAQTSITAVNVFGPVSSTMDTDVVTTCLAGNLIEVGGANYYNRYAEEGYTTPETDLTDFDSDTQFTASAIRLQGGEGLLESAAAIQLEGGYLVGQGSLLLTGDGQFSIDQTAGTSAGLLLSSAELDVTIDAQVTPQAQNQIQIGTESYTIDSQLTVTGGDLDSGELVIQIDAQCSVIPTIIEKSELQVSADFAINVIPGFVLQGEAAIQSDGFALTVAQYKIVDPFRTIRVKTETRTILVPQEDRLVLIDDETRVNKVGQEIRSYIVPQETRLIKAQHLILDRGTPVGSNERRIG